MWFYVKKKVFYSFSCSQIVFWGCCCLGHRFICKHKVSILSLFFWFFLNLPVSSFKRCSMGVILVVSYSSLFGGLWIGLFGCRNLVIYLRAVVSATCRFFLAGFFMLRNMGCPYSIIVLQIILYIVVIVCILIPLPLFVRLLNCLARFITFFFIVFVCMLKFIFLSIVMPRYFTEGCVMSMVG